MVPGRDLVQNELANWLGEELKPPEILIRFNLLYNVAMLVKSGFGDALTVRLDWTYPGLKFVPLAPPLRLGSVLVYKKQQVTSLAVNALIAHAKKYIDGISGNTR